MSSPRTARRLSVLVGLALLVTAPQASAALLAPTQLRSAAVAVEEEPKPRERDCVGDPNVELNNPSGTPSTLVIAGSCPTEDLPSPGGVVGEDSEEQEVAAHAQRTAEEAAPDEVYVGDASGEDDGRSCIGGPSVAYHNPNVFPQFGGLDVEYALPCEETPNVSTPTLPRPLPGIGGEFDLDAEFDNLAPDTVCVSTFTENYKDKPCSPSADAEPEA